MSAPRVAGTVVRAALALGDGSAIVHGETGVLAVPTFDPEAAVPVVLATYAELAQDVLVDGQRDVDVAKAITAREARAWALAA